MVLPAAAPANTRLEDLWVIVQLADQEGKKQKCRSQELRKGEMPNFSFHNSLTMAISEGNRQSKTAAAHFEKNGSWVQVLVWALSIRIASVSSTNWEKDANRFLDKTLYNSPVKRIWCEFISRIPFAQRLKSLFSNHRWQSLRQGKDYGRLQDRSAHFHVTKKKISYKYALTSLLEMPANMFSSCCSLKPAHSKLHVLKCVRRLLVRWRTWRLKLATQTRLGDFKANGRSTRYLCLNYL